MEHTHHIADDLDLARWSVNGRTVTVSGEIDASSVEVLARALAECADRDAIELLDLSGITFFSAAGASALARFGARRDRSVRIVGSPPVVRVLGLCGLGTILGSDAR